MPGCLPQGDPAPVDGQLPHEMVAAAAGQPLSAYVHIPFCSSRCGYCDFTTYTPAELGATPEHVQPGASPRRAEETVGESLVRPYVQGLLAEMELARRVLPDTPPLQTVFFGGGTPTLLPAQELGAILQALREVFGLAVGAEVTTEANPETITRPYLDALLAAGFTRISLGMQSATPHVLATLQRRHTPGMAARAARMAGQAGFAHVNLDLIYGTPGETEQDWADSLAQVIQTGVDHVSAYALIVEPGTRLAAQVRRGQLHAPDDDVLADRYLQCEKTLTDNGFSAYEVSNWALSPGDQCRHNLAYWHGQNWWGFGTGAHSHLGVHEFEAEQSLRWWNVRHPRDYAARLAQQHSPAAGRELLGPQEVITERVLLRLRLAEGLALDQVPQQVAIRARTQIPEGLLDPVALDQGRLVLTLRGRLLADAVVRTLLG